MGGIAFARHLKEDIALKHIPLIAFTAYTLDDEAEDSALFENMLYKPVRRADLIQVVTRTLKDSKVAGIRVDSSVHTRVVLVLHDKALKRMVDFCCSGEQGQMVTLGSLSEMQKYIETHEADRLVVDLDFLDTDVSNALVKDVLHIKGQRIALVNTPGDPRLKSGIFNACLVKPLTILDVYQLWSETNRPVKRHSGKSGEVPEVLRILPPKIAAERLTLVTLIEEEILPKAESLRQFRSTLRISALCQELESLGRLYELDYLVRFSNILLDASRTFQVDQTGYLLDILPEILKGITVALKRDV